MSSSSSGVGSRDSGTSSGTTSSNPVAATTSSTVTPGCTDRSRIRWSGVAKSNVPRFDTTRRTSKYRAGPSGPSPSAAARSQPTPVTVSTCSTNTRGPCLGTQYDVVQLSVLPGAPR